MPDAAVAERTLPHNLEAERSVLGAILLHNDAFNLAAEVIDASDFFRDAHRRIFDKMVKLVRARRRDRSGHAEGGAGAIRRSRRGRRPRLHHGARRRRAALDQRRALRADHQGEGDPPESDLLGEQDSRDRLRRRGGRRRHPRPGGARDLRDRRRQGARRLRLAARPGAVQPRHDREAARAQGADHRRADRLHRSRRDDVGPAAVGPDHRRGAAVDGEDQPGAEHGAARRHQDRHDGRHLQPRDVEGAAVPAHADRRGAHRRAPAARRLPRRARLGPAVAGDRHAERGEDLHRRHAVDRRARDAREVPPARRRARPAPGHHRLHPADAGTRPVREPHARARRRFRGR